MARTPDLVEAVEAEHDGLFADNPSGDVEDDWSRSVEVGHVQLGALDALDEGV